MAFWEIAVVEEENRIKDRFFYLIWFFFRLATITTAVLTFWYGLALAPNQVIDVATGTFNTFPFRILALVSIGLLQVGATQLCF